MSIDRYSRIVLWLKILLPIFALALLSTLFMLSRGMVTEPQIPFAEKDVQSRLRDQQITGPIYHGTTFDGDEVSFTAGKIITQDNGIGGNEAQDIEVKVDLSSGAEVALMADHGYFDIAADRAEMRGNVEITTSSGFRVESDHLISAFSVLQIQSPGPVDAVGPAGTLRAGGLTLSSGTAKDASLLVFTNGVKLVYTPRGEGE
ncbi:MAG: hypothetical protein AAF755_00935 [Pseudomonadota bacterium]